MLAKLYIWIISWNLYELTVETCVEHYLIFQNETETLFYCSLCSSCVIVSSSIHIWNGEIWFQTQICNYLRSNQTQICVSKFDRTKKRRIEFELNPELQIWVRCGHGFESNPELQMWVRTEPKSGILDSVRTQICTNMCSKLDFGHKKQNKTEW